MTLMVNIRHVFYGISLLERFHSMGKKRWYMIFGLTDETYSLLCTTKVPSGVEEEKFLFVISMMNQSYWVIGSAIGGIAGSLLPFQFRRHRLCHDRPFCCDLCGAVDGEEKSYPGIDRGAGSASLFKYFRGRKLCTAMYAADHMHFICIKEEAGRERE